MYGFYPIKYHLKDLCVLVSTLKEARMKYRSSVKALAVERATSFQKYAGLPQYLPSLRPLWMPPWEAISQWGPPLTQNPDNLSWLPSVQRSSSSMQRFSWITELPLLSKREAERPSPETSAELLASSILFSLLLSKKSCGRGEKSKGKIKESFASSEPKPILLLPMHLNRNLLPSSLQSHYWGRGWIWRTSMQLCVIYL